MEEEKLRKLEAEQNPEVEDEEMQVSFKDQKFIIEEQYYPTSRQKVCWALSR